MKKPPLDPVDHEHTWVITPDGRRVLVGLRQDTPETLPSGERIFTRHVSLIADASGQLINPDDPRVVTCSCCDAYPLVETNTRTCAECERTACLNCSVRLPPPEEPEPDAEPQYLCQECARHARRNVLVRFFFSFG